MIVTIAVMTVGVIGITASLAQTEKIAGITQDQSQIEVAMRQLADYVRDSSSKGLGYLVCTPSDGSIYTSKLPAVPPGVTQWGVSAVIYASSAKRNGVPTTPIQACTSGGDWGVQELTIYVKDGSRTLTRTVWKSQSW